MKSRDLSAADSAAREPGTQPDASRHMPTRQTRLYGFMNRQPTQTEPWNGRDGRSSFENRERACTRFDRCAAALPRSQNVGASTTGVRLPAGEVLATCLWACAPRMSASVSATNPRGVLDDADPPVGRFSSLAENCLPADFESFDRSSFPPGVESRRHAGKSIRPLGFTYPAMASTA